MNRQTDVIPQFIMICVSTHMYSHTQVHIHTPLTWMNRSKMLVRQLNYLQNNIMRKFTQIISNNTMYYIDYWRYFNLQVIRCSTNLFWIKNQNKIFLYVLDQISRVTIVQNQYSACKCHKDLGCCFYSALSAIFAFVLRPTFSSSQGGCRAPGIICSLNVIERHEKREFFLFCLYMCILKNYITEQTLKIFLLICN